MSKKKDIIRKDKAFTDKLFFINKHKNSENNWTIDIEGSTGKIYKINISDKLNCECGDFLYRRKVCKHLYFIFGKILGNLKIIAELLKLDSVNTYNIYKNFHNLSNDIEQIHQNIPNFAKQNIKLDNIIITENCVICFEELGNINDLINCYQCKNYFHTQCLHIWKKKSRTCPLCRTII